MPATANPKLLLTRSALEQLAARMEATCKLLREEREQLPRDDDYLAQVAALDEVIWLEANIARLRRIAKRRP